MSIYSFTIKKGKYVLDLSTTDKELVAGQFDMWVKKASEYARKHRISECKNIVNNQIRAEQEITNKNIEKELARHPISELPKPDRSEKEVETQPTFETKIDKNDKEKVESNLDIFYAPPTQKAFNDSISTIVHDTENAPVFDNILEQSLQNPQTELTFQPNPTIQKDNAFLNFVGSRNITRKIDYLLLVSYYFTQYEQKPRFTLKQINTKLMQNLAVIIDHAVLQEGINRGYIECLPDLTGLVGASEYRLTSYGEKTLFDE